MFSRKPDQRMMGQVNRIAAVDAEQIPIDGAANPGSSFFREPARRNGAESAALSDETVISSDLMIVGNVVSKGRVRLEGTIEGDMRCASLEVGESGAVTGTIVADEVAVYGKVSGTVRGKSVRLFSTAHVEGDIFHQGIGIEMGTHYDGRLKWADNPSDDELGDGMSQNGNAPFVGVTN